MKKCNICGKQYRQVQGARVQQCDDCARKRVPYSQFCLQPQVCHGRSACPRNYSCCE